MSNESPDNFSLWKNKLEELDTLPQERLDKSVVWQKLHERLQEKNTGKSIAWYWMAAACLLLILVMTRLIETKKQTPLVQSNIHQKQSYKTTASVALNIHKNDTANILSEGRFNKKHQSSGFSTTVNKISHPVTHIADTNTEASTAVVQEQRRAQEDLNHLIPADTFHAVIAQTLYRKKLRVIHINELGQPIEEPGFARNERPAFPFGINKRNIFSGSSIPNSDDHNIFKISISPQN